MNPNPMSLSNTAFVSFFPRQSPTRCSTSWATCCLRSSASPPRSRSPPPSTEALERNTPPPEWILLFFLEGRKRVFKAANTQPLHPTPLQQNWTWPCEVLSTWSCHWCSGLAASSTTGTAWKCIRCYDRVERSKSGCWNCLQASGGAGLLTDFYDAVTSAASARDYSVFFFLLLRACSLGLSVWSLG